MHKHALNATKKKHVYLLFNTTFLDYVSFNYNQPFISKGADLIPSPHQTSYEDTNYS